MSYIVDPGSSSQLYYQNVYYHRHDMQPGPSNAGPHMVVPVYVTNTGQMPVQNQQQQHCGGQMIQAGNFNGQQQMARVVWSQYPQQVQVNQQVNHQNQNHHHCYPSAPQRLPCGHYPAQPQPQNYVNSYQQYQLPYNNNNNNSINNMNYENNENRLMCQMPPRIYMPQPCGMRTVSHTKNLIGPAFDRISIGINRKNQRTLEQLSISEVYDLISTLKVSETDLLENGYPLFTVDSPSVAVIQPTKYDKDKKAWIEKNEKKRICCRCNREFGLNLDGSFPMEKAICRYHNRGLIIQGKKQTYEKKHSCCGEEWNQSEGCKLSDVHVTNQQFLSELANFMSTPKPTGPGDTRSRTFYALDCEMVYTIYGSALARLSVVDFYGNPILDVFIKPPHPVLDPNTEFSGLTMKDIENATDTLETCREKLFKLINSETILIGHSLESDLKAMRIVHHNVVDTSILFTSGRGTKLPLRSLASTHLKRFIQSDNDDADGHCSFEDAKVCIDLVRLKLKNLHA